MMNSRRDFLKGTAWMGAMAFAAGCRMNRLGFGTGGTMMNYALKPMKKVRVAFAGIGGRGTGAVHRVAMIPGCEIVGLCDLKQERIDENLAWLRKMGHKTPKTWSGEDGWKAMCEWDGADVVYIASPWHLHAPMSLAAMRGGKVALCEVTPALTVDDCWELVDTCESTKKPCMILENCCYDSVEMLTLNMARQGVLGELVHCEGAYIHDLRHFAQSATRGEGVWRYGENLEHKGNRYPTHGLVPLMQHFGINRGDQFDYLVSLESDQFNWDKYIREVLPKDDPRRGDHKVEMGDMNSTLIRTKKGKSFLIQHDVSTPRPYTRLQLVSGTRGTVAGWPLRIALEKENGGGAHAWLEKGEEFEKLRQQYEHPLWKQVGAIAKKVGGHGGMDFIMDLRWAYCLQNGLPLDMDVYDLAASSCLVELTEKSVRNRSEAIDVPDFTRGAWKNTDPIGILTVDTSKIDFGRTCRDEAALNV